MNRSHRAKLAAETLSILQKGYYVSPSGRKIDLSAALAASLGGTQLYTPEELELELEYVRERDSSYCETVLEVSNETTLEAGMRLRSETSAPLACLNFASAKNPGGGFLTGSQAQEESLARATGLYFSLLSRMKFYEYHRVADDPLYSDHIIYSPMVPVIRDSKEQLLDEPFFMSIITCAAPNARVISSENDADRIQLLSNVLRIRSSKILAVALKNSCRHLVLGAWGCGVFLNSPVQVASSFKEHLGQGGHFTKKFCKVVFAIYDKDKPPSIFNAFENVFKSTYPGLENSGGG